MSAIASLVADAYDHHAKVCQGGVPTCILQYALSVNTTVDLYRKA